MVRRRLHRACTRPWQRRFTAARGSPGAPVAQHERRRHVAHDRADAFEAVEALLPSWRGSGARRAARRRARTGRCGSRRRCRFRVQTMPSITPSCTFGGRLANGSPDRMRAGFGRPRSARICRRSHAEPSWKSMPGKRGQQLVELRVELDAEVARPWAAAAARPRSPGRCPGPNSTTSSPGARSRWPTRARDR
jgi:hypothetical protein